LAPPAPSENYERARTLCEEIGDAHQLFEIVHALWYPQLARSDEAAARRGVDELVRIAERVNTADFTLRSELARGRVDLRTGHFEAAVRIFAARAAAVCRDQDVAYFVPLGQFLGGAALAAETMSRPACRTWCEAWPSSALSPDPFSATSCSR